MKAARRAEFEQFVRREAKPLFRTSFLLVGNRSEAEDLLQEALERTYRRWGRATIDHPAAYVRRAMVNLASNRWRRRRLVSVVLTSDHEVAVEDDTDTVHQRAALMQALAALSRRQRAVLVLRYWEDLTEHETARSLGCSVGSVKRHTSRALDRLRDGVVAVDERHPLSGFTQPVAPANRSVT